MVNQAGGYTSVKTWSKPTYGIVDHVVSLIGFKLGPESCIFLSYQVSLSLSPTQGLINLNPINSKIFELEFTIALITAACSSDF